MSVRVARVGWPEFAVMCADFLVTFCEFVSSDGFA